MEILQTFNVSISNGNIKYPIEKKIAVNLTLKLLLPCVANADLSLKSVHTFCK